MAIKPTRNETYALGIAVSDGWVELYGVNRLNDLMLHGWFDLEAGLNIVWRRRPCLILVAEGVLPKEFTRLLETAGHSVIAIPMSAELLNSPNLRTAKHHCDIAMGWSELALDLRHGCH